MWGLVYTPQEWRKRQRDARTAARHQRVATRDIGRALAALAVLDARAQGRHRPSHSEYLPELVKHFAAEAGFHPSTISASARRMRRILENWPHFEGRIRRGELGYVAAQKEDWAARKARRETAETAGTGFPKAYFEDLVKPRGDLMSRQGVNGFL